MQSCLSGVVYVIQKGHIIQPIILWYIISTHIALLDFRLYLYHHIFINILLFWLFIVLDQDFHFLNIFCWSPLTKISIPLVFEIFCPELSEFFIFSKNHARSWLLNLEFFGNIWKRTSLSFYFLNEFLSLLNEMSNTLKEILEYLRLDDGSLSKNRICYELIIRIRKIIWNIKIVYKLKINEVRWY